MLPQSSLLPESQPPRFLSPPPPRRLIMYPAQHSMQLVCIWKSIIHQKSACLMRISTTIAMLYPKQHGPLKAASNSAALIELGIMVRWSVDVQCALAAMPCAGCALVIDPAQGGSGARRGDLFQCLAAAMASRTPRHGFAHTTSKHVTPDHALMPGTRQCLVIGAFIVGI